MEATGIHAWYGSSHVLHGIDLTIRRGETLGLLGRNGMGKSTLIRTLLGHVAQRDGHMAFRGQDCSHAQPHEVARLGVAYVPGLVPLTIRKAAGEMADTHFTPAGGTSFDEMLPFLKF